MLSSQPHPMSRRRFLTTSLGSGAGLGLAMAASKCSAAGRNVRRAGEGTVDITPPVDKGIELAGFHRPPGNPRLVTGARQPSLVRALMLEVGSTRAVVIVLDMLNVSQAFSRRVAQQVESRTGVPSSQVRVCATHSHSMPRLRDGLQWGGLHQEYQAMVEVAAVEAVTLAQADLAPAVLSLGTSQAQGGNFNRTTKTWRTDAEFDEAATEKDRWLDTTLHALLFERPAGKSNLLWYHFSAHPVCFRDTQSGPDWPGIVAEMTRDSHQVVPSFLYGHAGDVNPGDGTIWIGEPEPTATAIHAALCRALDQSQRVDIDAIRCESVDFKLPLDIERFEQWLAQYRRNPEECNRGHWRSAEFAEAWFRIASQYDTSQTQLSVPLSVMRLGSIGWVFHPSELYSFYGLAIRRDSPLNDTVVVSMADGAIGYLPDERAFAAGEYSALTVPKIMGLPPYQPAAAAMLTRGAVELLQKTV